MLAPPPRDAMSWAVAERDALFARMVLDTTNLVLLAEYIAAEDTVKRLEAAAAADAANAAADTDMTAAVASGDAIRISAAARAKLVAQGSVDALARSSNQPVSPALAAPAVAQSAAATTGLARPSTLGAASSDDDDDDADSDYSEESGDEEGGTGRKRHRRSWERSNGPKYCAAQAAARAAGAARLPTSGTAVVPYSRKPVIALNASRDSAAVGTGVVRSITKLVAGEACVACSDQTDALLVHLAPARLRASAASTSKAYNLSRLKELLILHAFDARGNFSFHRHCLCMMLRVSGDFITDAHHKAIAWNKAPTIERFKEVVMKDAALRERVVVPLEATSRKAYLDQLPPNTLVTLTTTSPADLHGLAGKRGNRANAKAREFFVNWVRAVRSSTGRTPDRSGRYHGPVYYMPSSLTQLKERCGAAAKSNGPQETILTCAFQRALETYNKETDAGITVCAVRAATLAAVMSPR